MVLLKLEVEATNFLINESNHKNIAVSFSGGKDSLVVLDLAIRVGVTNFVFADTTIEFPTTLDYIDEIERYYGIKITRVRAPNDFFEIVDKIGFPSRRLRWCCDVFKFSPLTHYARANNIDGFITGLRSSESNKRADYSKKDDNPLVSVSQINPILEWKKEDVWNYIEKYNLPSNPLYDKMERIGCWCCPYKTNSEMKIVQEEFPKLWRVLESHLHAFAKKINISDLDNFINNNKWTGWASPQRKIPIGTRTLCTGSHHTETVGFYGKDSIDAEKIMQLLPIITNDFNLIGNNLRITLKNGSKTTLNILIEKALNCIGCGGCISVCPYNALEIENGFLKVNPKMCNMCLRCLKTNLIKGACINRNYAPKRKTIASYA